MSFISQRIQTTGVALVCLVSGLFLCGCNTHKVVNNVDLSCQQTCWQQTGAAYTDEQLSAEQLLDQQIDQYKILVEETLSYRAQAIAFAKVLKQRGDQDQPLSGKELHILKQGLIRGLALREKLFTTAYFHSCWSCASSSAFAEVGLDILSEQTRLKGVMLSLSAALVLYDNYLLMISIFENDQKLRRFLNDQDIGYELDNNELLHTSFSYSSREARQQVRDALAHYEKQKNKFGADLFDDENTSYLDSLINQSPSYTYLRKSSPFFVTGLKLRFMYLATIDMMNGLQVDGMDLFSKLFGNSVGLVAVRKGKLYQDETMLSTIASSLQAGDILLESTPFRLTDKLIPGHWGHAAIWIGTKEELQDLGLWDHPLVVKYHQAIEEGRGVAEALRSGVELNSLEHFSNVDDLAILRKELTREQLKERIILTLRQIGKAYDFNFDVETTDKIVCSELVYTVFVDMEWPTQKSLGRRTISPDHIAQKTIGDGPLETIVLYHDGMRVEDHAEKMELLLAED